MGVSIFSGYVTTIGSGIFLLNCGFSFFYKFGQTISLTVTFAWLVATFTFGAMMKAFGPEKNFGSVYALCMKRDKSKIA